MDMKETAVGCCPCGSFLLKKQFFFNVDNLYVVCFLVVVGATRSVLVDVMMILLCLWGNFAPDVIIVGKGASEAMCVTTCIHQGLRFLIAYCNECNSVVG